MVRRSFSATLTLAASSGPSDIPIAQLTVRSSAPSWGELCFLLASVYHGAHIEEQKYFGHSDETVNGESCKVIRRKLAADDVPFEQSVALQVEPLNFNELSADQGNRRDEDWKSAENGADGRILSPAPNRECRLTGGNTRVMQLFAPLTCAHQHIRQYGRGLHSRLA
jgi:hypothetical protein